VTFNLKEIIVSVGFVRRKILPLLESLRRKDNTTSDI
jgi:hypothetical protein